MTRVRDQDKFMLRLPDGMRERLKAAAESAGRSMNAEIIERIEAPQEKRSIADVLIVLEKIEERLAALEKKL